MQTHGYSLLLLVILSSCDSGSGAPRDAGADVVPAHDAAPDTPMPAPLQARFVLPATGLPAPLAVPWPSDVYRTDADGTIADGLSDWRGANLGPVVNFEAYGALDGFGRTTGALFALDGEASIDPATLPTTGAAGAMATASVAILDLETPAGQLTRVPCTAGYNADVGVLTVTPDLVTLEAGHRYAVVVTSAVRAQDGRPLAAAPAFEAIRDNATGARATPAGRLYGEGVDLVATRGGIDRARIVALTVYTTQTAHRRLRPIRDALVAGGYGPAPSLITDPARLQAPYRYTRFGVTAHAGWTATLDAWLGAARRGADGRDLPGNPTPLEPMGTGVPHDAVGAALVAAYASPEFRRPFTGTARATDGTIAFDAMGRAVAQDMNRQVPLIVLLPRTPAPSGGYPVVIFQHGAGGDRTHVGALGNELARAGFAVVAIDAPGHGARGVGAVDVVNSAPGIYRGPDGIADGSSTAAQLQFFGNLLNFLVIRDNLWQAALDLVQLRRLVGTIDLAVVADAYSGTAPRLDASHVGYVGMSMGGVLATLLGSVEPRSSIDPLVLDVAASSVFLHGLGAGPNGILQLTLLTLALRLPQNTLLQRHHPWLQLAQGLVDSADASSFVGEVSRGDRAHNLYVITAADDDTAPRPASDAFARGLGVVQVTPTIREIPGLVRRPSPLTPDMATGLTQGVFEISPGNHGHLLARFNDNLFEPPWPNVGMRVARLPAPVPVRQSIVGVQRSMVRFLTTAFAGRAEIAVTGSEYPGLNPVADFDDDGFCDDQERRASPASNPFDPASRPAGGVPMCVRDVGFPGL